SAYDLGYKHNNSELPPLGLLRADIPAELNRLIEQLLKKEPEQRPAHAAEVRQTLMALADGGQEVSGWAEYDPREALPILEPASLLPDPAGHRPHEGPLSVMDVFTLHDQLIKEYRDFTEGGVIIRDAHIAEHLSGYLAEKSQ